MPGLPTKTFELEIAPLWPQEPQGVPGDKIAPGLKGLLEPKRWELLSGHSIVPLGLRWRVKPDLGLPREAFSVWRRDRNLDDPLDVKFNSTQVTGFHLGGGVYHLPTGPLYVLIVGVRNTDPAQAVTVQALDEANNPLLLQSVQVPANSLRLVRFQHPFIGGFSCPGAAVQITSVVGVTMTGFIGRKEEWELIEVVGLPAVPGEIDGYDPGMQGFPSQPESPPDAALVRLQIAQQFYRPLATGLPSGVTVPVWDIPEPKEAVAELRGGSPSLLQRLSDMLGDVDAGTAGSQAEYRASVTMPGIRQPEFPNAVTADATMDLPLLVTVLLNAVTDPWFALASGFGTTDFPKFLASSERYVEPPTYFHISYDYMVSATFRFRLFGSFEFKQEHAALSHRSAFPPLQPAGLTSEVYARNRPPRRDDPWSAEIALTWNKTNRLQIQGNALAVAENGLTGAYLNPLRPAVEPGALADKPALLVPANPGAGSDPLLHTRNRFFHHHAPMPFTGTSTDHYGLATMDAFGRWSDWSAVDQLLAALLPEAPRLGAVSLTADRTRIVGNTAPHELKVEIVWDWQDRSPKRFQLAAVFHCRHYFPDGTKDNGQVPPSDYPAIFQTDNTVSAGALLELSFPSDQPPGTPPVFEVLPTCPDPRVSVELLPQATNSSGQNVEGEMRRYRITMRDLNVAFQPDEEWYFTLFVKAAEWRNPALLSDSTPPLLPGRPLHLTAYVPNPIPAPPPAFVPATVLWAALPDARGVSRFRLAFDPVPGATGGYAVFQAFEAKLRDMAGLPVRDDPNLVGRATDLRDLAMPIDRCIDAFNRLNATLIPPPAPGAQVEYEVEIPGTLAGLLAFAVASVTREQEISALSTPWLFVAVPRRSPPAPPFLALAGHDGTVTLTCDFPKAPKPARVEILRARREFAAREADTMGPPLHESLEAEWQALDDQGRSAASEADTSRYRFSFDDATPPSWFPYYYRAVAVGARDDVNGFVPGRSPQSNRVRFERLPATLPDIADVAANQVGAQTIRVTFGSDAPVESTPHGTFRLEILVWDFAQNQFAATPALSVLLSQAEPLPGGGNPGPGQVYYSGPDAAGRRAFEARFDVTGSQYLLRVRLTDPLNRTSERTVSGKLAANEAPNLANLSTRRIGLDLFVFFASSTTIVQPPFGAYMLELSFVPALHGGIQLLLSRALHQIKAGNFNVLRTSLVTTILRRQQPNPDGSFEYGAVIKRFFSASPLHLAHSGRLRVRLTAPDGQAVKLEVGL